jgi:hypothetical protein
MTLRFCLHAGSISDANWCASQGFAEVGLVVPYGTVPSANFIHNAGIKTATLNIFNDGATGGPGSAGSQFAGMFQAIKAANWDMVGGEGAGGDVVRTAMNYMYWVDYAGAGGADGGQIDAYAAPWNHPTTGKFGHCDYIETYVQATQTKTSTINKILAAKAKGSIFYGPLIELWSTTLNWGAQYYIDIINQSGANSVLFWGGYSVEGVSTMQGIGNSIFQQLKNHFGMTPTSGVAGSGGSGIYTDPNVKINIALKNPVPNVSGRTDAATAPAGTKVTITGTCTTLHQLSLWRIQANASGENVYTEVMKFWPENTGGQGTFSISDTPPGSGLVTYRVGVV